MKIIGICGSPRKKANTEILLKETLDTVSKSGMDTELILLREKKIELCRGCDEKCQETGECIIVDDMQEVYEKLISADGIILGSPTYFDNVSALMKNFMDRTDPLTVGRKLKNKIAGLIAVGLVGPESIRKSVRAMMDFCECHRIIIKGEMMVKAYKEGEVLGKENILIEARKLGEKIVKSI